MTRILGRLASGRILGVTFVAVVVLQILVAVGIPKWLAGYAGSLNMFALDRPDHLDYGAALVQYGPQDRQKVVNAHLTWDVAIPAIYVLFFLSAFGLLARGDPPHRGLWTLAGGVAALAGVADIIENAGIITFLISNSVIGWLAWATAIATDLKWGLIVVAAGALSFGAGRCITAEARSHGVVARSSS